MSVVVDGKALRGARREVRVHLGRMPQRALERAAEGAELGPMQMQALEHDRGAALPLGEHAIDVRRAGEAAGAPRDFRRVVADGELLVRLDEPESREAQPARRDEALDLGLREEVVVAPGLVALDNERPALPVLGEELALADRLDAAPEGAGATSPCR